MYVVIGTSPSVDTSAAAGPFRNVEKALEASERMTRMGYNTEVCTLVPIDDITPVTDEEPA